jgi:hypothetical protein
VRSTGERLFGAVLVVVVFAVGATAADAKRKRAPVARTAVFSAELGGTQYARTDVGALGECEVDLPSGTSTERIEFQATAFSVPVTKLPGDVVVGRNFHVRVPVNGTVTRSNLGSAACQTTRASPRTAASCPSARAGASTCSGAARGST